MGVRLLHGAMGGRNPKAEAFSVDGDFFIRLSGFAIRHGNISFSKTQTRHACLEISFLPSSFFKNLRNLSTKRQPRSPKRPGLSRHIQRHLKIKTPKSMSDQPTSSPKPFSNSSPPTLA